MYYKQSSQEEVHRPIAMAACGCEIRSATAKSITSLNDLQCGDHIKVKRILYSHHMIVVTVVSETSLIVIHKRKAVVEEEVVAIPSKLTLLVYDSPYSREEIIQRARQRIGQDYHLLYANCEHFVTEVRTGSAVSLQIETARLLGILATATGSIFVGIVVMGAIVFEATRQRNRSSK